MATKIQLRNDTSANWSTSNPVLAQGEPGLESNTGKIKYGNGSLPWNCLPYASVGCASTCVTYAEIQDKNNACGPQQIALGRCAGINNQSTNAVAVGPFAGNLDQGTASVAIGSYAGNSNQGVFAVAIGCGAGQTHQGNVSVAIGCYAGHCNQKCAAVAIGLSAGQISQSSCAVAIGPAAGQDGQQSSAVAVGAIAGQLCQSAFAVAVGVNAGTNYQGEFSVAIGHSAAHGVAILHNLTDVCGTKIYLNNNGCVQAGMYVTGTAFNSNQRVVSVGACNCVVLSAAPCLPTTTGEPLLFKGVQGTYSTAIGTWAGCSGQGGGATAIGLYAGSYYQGNNAVAIGTESAAQYQGICSIAIGSGSGGCTQGVTAIAIGYYAGFCHQGDNAVAIGAGAGTCYQPSNSIIINASGCTLNGANSGFYVKPVRNDTGNVNVAVYYNTSTSELTYGPAGGIVDQFQQVAITNASNGLGGGGEGSVTYCVSNVAPIVSTGILFNVCGYGNQHAAGTPSTGSQTINWQVGFGTYPYAAYAYVTTTAGTVYSGIAHGMTGMCLLEGTLIALADGTYKPIEDITYDDLLLVWDFDRGCYAAAAALWIKRAETVDRYNLLTFSDGSKLGTIDQHRIFNKQAGAFTYPMTDATPIGTITVNQHGVEISLINKEITYKTVRYYNVITDYHVNLYANGILTSNRFNNIYPIGNMKFVKDSRILRGREEFAGIEDRFYTGLRLAEQTYDVAMIKWYVDRLVAMEHTAEYALA